MSVVLRFDPEIAQARRGGSVLDRLSRIFPGKPAQFSRDAKTFSRPENYDKIQDLPKGKELWAGGNDWENGWSWAGIHDGSRDHDGYIKEPEVFLEISHKECPGCGGENDPSGRKERKRCQEHAKKQVAEWLKKLTGKSLKMDRTGFLVRFASFFDAPAPRTNLTKIPVMRISAGEPAADHIHAGITGGQLTIKHGPKDQSGVGRKEDVYQISHGSPADATHSYVLTGGKRDANHVTTIGKTTPQGNSCTCEGFKFGSGKWCKHICALEGLGAAGKLQGVTRQPVTQSQPTPPPAPPSLPPSVPPSWPAEDPARQAIRHDDLRKGVDEQIAGTRLAYHLRQIEHRYKDRGPGEQQIAELARKALSGETNAYAQLGQALESNGDHEFANAYRWHKVKQGLTLDRRVSQALNNPRFDEHLKKILKSNHTKEEFLAQMSRLATTNFELETTRRHREPEQKKLTKDKDTWRHPAMQNIWRQLKGAAGVGPNNPFGDRLIAQSIMRHLFREEDRQQVSRSRAKTKDLPTGKQHSWQDFFNMLPGFAGNPMSTKRAKRDTSNPERFSKHEITEDQQIAAGHRASRAAAMASDTAFGSEEYDSSGVANKAMKASEMAELAARNGDAHTAVKHHLDAIDMHNRRIEQCESNIKYYVDQLDGRRKGTQSINASLASDKTLEDGLAHEKNVQAANLMALRAHMIAAKTHRDELDFGPEIKPHTPQQMQRGGLVTRLAMMFTRPLTTHADLVAWLQQQGITSPTLLNQGQQVQRATPDELARINAAMGGAIPQFPGPQQRPLPPSSTPEEPKLSEVHAATSQNLGKQLRGLKTDIKRAKKPRALPPRQPRQQAPSPVIGKPIKSETLPPEAKPMAQPQRTAALSVFDDKNHPAAKTPQAPPVFGVGQHQHKVLRAKDRSVVATYTGSTPEEARTRAQSHVNLHNELRRHFVQAEKNASGRFDKMGSPGERNRMIWYHPLNRDLRAAAQNVLAELRNNAGLAPKTKPQHTLVGTGLRLQRDGVLTRLSRIFNPVKLGASEIEDQHIRAGEQASANAKQKSAWATSQTHRIPAITKTWPGESWTSLDVKPTNIAILDNTDESANMAHLASRNGDVHEAVQHHLDALNGHDYILGKLIEEENRLKELSNSQRERGYNSDNIRYKLKDIGEVKRAHEAAMLAHKVAAKTHNDELNFGPEIKPLHPAQMTRGSLVLKLSRVFQPLRLVEDPGWAATRDLRAPAVQTPEDSQKHIETPKSQSIESMQPKIPSMDASKMNLWQLNSHFKTHGIVALSPGNKTHQAFMNMLSHQHHYVAQVLHPVTQKHLASYVSLDKNKALSAAGKHRELLGVAGAAAKNAGLRDVDIPDAAGDAEVLANHIWNNSANSQLKQRAEGLIHDMRRELGHQQIDKGYYRTSGTPLEATGMKLAAKPLTSVVYRDPMSNSQALTRQGTVEKLARVFGPQIKPWLRESEKQILFPTEKQAIYNFFGGAVPHMDLLHAGRAADLNHFNVTGSNSPEDDYEYAPNSRVLENAGWDHSPTLMLESYGKNGTASPRNPTMFSHVTLFKDADGNIRAYNGYFNMGKHGYAQGLSGRHMLRAQIEALRRLDVKSMHAHLADNPEAMIGYVPRQEHLGALDPSNPDHWQRIGYVGGRVWPLFGYGGKMHVDTLSKLPKQLLAKLPGDDVRDLLDLPNGKELWNQVHGDIYNGYMDLDPNSRTGQAHEKAWNEFLAKKGMKDVATNAASAAPKAAVSEEKPATHAAQLGRRDVRSARAGQRVSAQRPGHSSRIAPAAGRTRSHVQTGQLCSRLAMLFGATSDERQSIAPGLAGIPGIMGFPQQLAANSLNDMVSSLSQAVRSGQRPQMSMQQRRDLEEMLRGLELLIEEQKERGLSATPDEIQKLHDLNMLLAYPAGSLVLDRAGSPVRFASPGWPNTSSDLAAAIQRMQSANHKAYLQAVGSAFNAMALNPHKISPVVHMNSGSAQPAIAASIGKPVDKDSAEYAAAWMGNLAKQSGILAFHVDPGGPDSLYHMEIPGSGINIQAALNNSGISQAILRPKNSGVFTVTIHDPQRNMRKQVAGVAKQFGTTVGEVRGNGVQLGGDDPAEARATFRNIIGKFEGQAQ